MIRIEHGKPVHYIPDVYVRIHFHKKAHIRYLEGTQEACSKALNANPSLRPAIQFIEFLDRPAWKKVA